MDTFKKKINDGFNRIKLLKGLSEKVGAFRGETVIEIVKRFQKVRPPGLSAEVLALKEYDPMWPLLYEREKGIILNALAKKGVVDLQHIGSTAIPHQSSNNVIDMGLILEDLSVETGYKDVLSMLNYEDFGASPLGPKAVWFWKKPVEPPDAAFVLHVDDRSNAWFQGNLNFCNYLAAHPGERKIYNDLKKSIAELKKVNIMHYTLKKLEYMIEISGKADRWATGDR